ncbi:putative glutamate--cysteine ligase 2 [Actinomadura rubrobrunea]|uniref:Putative glutamate--cysteine ligase 2 n=1 Tax=Actinomadura rubrobrunea TaxID=115335 RepID=A0A9W6PQA0_9ACTN|nr:putative glutamate--cysteine ligase 2 [Actinomadura rubrobrunea]
MRGSQPRTVYRRWLGQNDTVEGRNGADDRTIGVEEELLLVDPDSGVPQAVSVDVIRYAYEKGEVPRGDRDPQVGSSGGESLETELQREQMEVCTRPCASLAELSAQIRWARRAASQAARGVGVAVAALATSPVAVRPSLTPSRRYRRMADAYGLTADEQLTCGCHVHVAVDSPEEGAAVLDRIRPWLPPLLALSANSPFWQGRDTGYDSWRHQVWGRWPSSGPTEVFESFKEYRSTVSGMLDTGVLLDEGMVYFDARVSHRYPTVEIRVADVCLRAEDAVLLAALVRALVDTAVREWRAGVPPDPVRTHLLRLAMWRASRSGLRGDLVHPVTHRAADARAVVSALLEHAAPALIRRGDLETVERLLRRLLDRGNGASVQRAVFTRTRDAAAVVADAVRRTLEF